MVVKPPTQMAIVRAIERPTMIPARRECCRSRLVKPGSVIGPFKRQGEWMKGESRLGSHPSEPGGVYHAPLW